MRRQNFFCVCVCVNSCGAVLSFAETATRKPTYGLMLIEDFFCLFILFVFLPVMYFNSSWRSF